MISSRLAIASCLCCGTLFARAQTRSVALVDTTGAPLEAAVVSVMPASALAETLVTDATGRACCLPATGMMDSLIVQHLGVGAVVVRPPYTLLGDTLLLVVLAGAEIQLPSATVLARYSGVLIRGDTVRFDAQRFADGRERDVADLLRQLPGIEVDDEGKVTYLGKTVERLLLNGQDVLRSQFSALNALIGSAEIKTAEIVTEQVKASAAETQTLNIVTAGGKALRTDLQLGLSTHGDGIASATVLYAPKEGWQLFGTAGYDGTGGSAISGQDERKRYDWDLVSARQSTSLGSDIFHFVTGGQNVQAAERDHYAAQATASRVYGDRETSFFARYIRADEIERGREDVFDARTTELLGSLRRSKSVITESAMLTVAHSDTSVAKLKVDLWGGLLFDGQLFGSQGVSTFDSIGGEVLSQQPFAFRQNLPRPGAYLTGKAVYELSERWDARATVDYQANREDATRSFGDSYRLFDLVGLEQAGGQFVLGADTRRGAAVATADARAVYHDSLWRVPLIAQYTQRAWRERLNSVPATEIQLTTPLSQREGTYTVATEPGFEKGKISAGATLGMSRVNYERAGFGESRLAPLLGLNAAYEFTQTLRLSLNLSHGTTGYGADDYWATVTPRDTRTLTRGFTATTPFTRRTNASANLSLWSQDNGLSGGLYGSASRSDTTLSYLPVVADDYVAYRPTLSFDQRDQSVNVYGSYRKDKVTAYVGGNVSRSRSTIDPVDPVAYERLNAWTYANFSYKIVAWLQVNGGYYYSASQQTTTPEGEAPASTSLDTHQPSLGLTYRGKQLTIAGNGSVQFGANVPTLPVVGGRVTYKHPKRPATVELRVDDILNYDNSTFRSLDLSPGNLRATTYERIRGYVALVARYTLGRAEAAKPANGVIIMGG